MNLFENFKKLISNENEIQKQEKLIVVNNDEISEDEIDLAQKLDAIEIYTVDRIEDSIAVLEDRNKGEMLDVSIKQLPDDIKAGDILKKINGKYFIDEEKIKSVEKRIEDKMNDLWND